MSRTTRRVYFFVLAILFVIATPIVILYAMGFRFDGSEFLVSERGAVYVYTTIAGTDIFIDDELEDTTGVFNREYISDSIPPGRYFVRAEHPEFQTWEKYVEVHPQRVVSVYPFLVPNEFEFEEVPALIEGDQNATTTLVQNVLYEEYVEFFVEPDVATSTEVVATVITPEEEEQEVLRRIFGNIEVWYEDDGQTFFARWLGRGDYLPAYFCENSTCQSPFAFLSVNEPVIHLDFYPGRDDVIIFSSVDGGVYAVELDKRPPQKFVTLYYGTQGEVDFRLVDRNTLVITDDNQIFITTLES